MSLSKKKASGKNLVDSIAKKRAEQIKEAYSPTKAGEKSIKEMSPSEFFWFNKKIHDQKLEEEKQEKKAKKKAKKEAKPTKKGSEAEAQQKLASKKQKTSEVANGAEKGTIVEENKKPAYVIPLEELKKPEKKKGTKKKTKEKDEKAAKDGNGIHLIKDEEILRVKMPKYEEYKEPARKRVTF